MTRRGIVPPFLLDRLALDADGATRDAAARTRAHVPTTQPRAPHLHEERRIVYTCGTTMALPGTLVRREGSADIGDADADRAYAAAGETYAFFSTVFGRDSIDGRGMHLISSVHFGERYCNAFWNGAQMVYGDGDGAVFSPFTSCLDVVAHELTHGVVQADCGIEYLGEAGALSESLADVFGTLVKQWQLGQRVEEADWLIGAGMFRPGIRARALRSLAEPGSAFDDPRIGRDPQPAHMRDFVPDLPADDAAHVNSGIPNHAFYLFARRLGGCAWETAGATWYDALRLGLPRRCDFDEFARATVHCAAQRGADVAAALRHAWRMVGLVVA